jgi:phenylacetate-coenzyme A ligase PaaK-like adenylate-forming protein
LREANRVSISLVKIAGKQLEMLEDKYNCFLEANDETGEMVLKKKIKQSEEAPQSLQERILDRLQNELYGALNSMVLSIHSQQISDNVKLALKIDMEV